MARLVVALLGPMYVTLDGQPVTGFKYDKVRALLAYLAVEAERPHERSALLGLLWPDLPEDAARNNLRQTLLTLRDAIGDRAAHPPFLLTSRAALQFNRESNYWLDVTSFTTLLAACERHAHGNPASCKACAQRLQQAVELYKGAFLAEFFLPDSETFEEWAVLKREWLHRLLLNALEQLIAYHERRGQYDRALVYAQRLLSLDPWREEIHRDVMRLHLLNGERSAALEQFEQCRRLLAEELGVEPEAETQTLYEHIRNGKERIATALSLPAARRHTLPTQPTPFVGREAELSAIGRILDNGECRMLTLTGPGGIGKTRLALQAATERVDTFADGVFFVSLAGLPTAELLVSALAAALELELGAAADPRAHLLQHLRGREMLLVLDNFEHLLDGAELLTDILHHAPEVTLLVTSRARLNLRAEWLFDVPGLPLPALPRGPLHERDWALVTENDAAQLFTQSAQRVRATFALSPQNVESVVQICHLGAGTPLAIELAATWVRALSCEEIAQTLLHSLDLLATTLRDTPARHRSLRAVFDHSWQLLNTEEQAVLRRLAVFRGGFGRRAAEAVAHASLPVLATLVDQSLMSRSPSRRYTLHELLRQYLSEKLEQAGESTAVHQRYAAHYLHMAEAAEPHLTGAEQIMWLDRLEEEQDNLRTVLQWSLDHGDAETAARLGGAVWRFWQYRGHIDEGRRWLERALDSCTSSLSPATRAKASKGAGALAWVQGDYQQATQLFEMSLALFQELGDKDGIAAVYNNLGVLAMHRGNYAEALRLLEASLSLRRETGDLWGVTVCLNNLGATAGRQGDNTRARAYYEEALALSRETGDKMTAAMTLGNLGVIAEDQNDWSGAHHFFTETLALWRELDDRRGVANAQVKLGRLALRRGDIAQAHTHYAQSLSVFQELEDKEHVVACLEGFAQIVAAQGDLERACMLWAAAAAQRDALSTPLPPGQRADYERNLQQARDHLTDVLWEAVWAKGQAMSLEGATAYTQTILCD